ETTMSVGPRRSFISALVELPDVRDAVTRVPNFSQRGPSLPRLEIAAVRSIPASPNSSVPGLSPFEGLIASIVDAPPNTAASAMLAGSGTSGVHAEPVHWEYEIDALPLWKS